MHLGVQLAVNVVDLHLDDRQQLDAVGGRDTWRWQRSSGRAGLTL